MTEKPKTRAQLEAIIADVTANLGRTRQVFDVQRLELEGAIKREKETRSQFDDLKRRLVLAEAHNQRMRGYIARVQEDDTVREELVATGDPAGQQNLVPKRKPTLFCEPVPYAHPESNGFAGYMERTPRERAPLKHWITY